MKMKKYKKSIIYSFITTTCIIGLTGCDYNYFFPINTVKTQKQIYKNNNVTMDIEDKNSFEDVFYNKLIPDVQPRGTLEESINIEFNNDWDFSFVQISDLHIGEGYSDYGTSGFDDLPPQGDVGYPTQKLRTAVNWINTNNIQYKIQFVMVVGDITDSGEKSEFLKAKEILDTLKVPYIPLIGNHDIWPYTNTEEALSPCGDIYFKEVFQSQFNKLSNIFNKWDNGTRLIKTWNPEVKHYSYLQNFAFDYHGYHFICSDFNSRQHAPFNYKGAKPEANLYDFKDGTFQWLKKHITDYPFKKQDNIFIFAHHPLTKLPGMSVLMSFNNREYGILTNFLGNYKNNIGLYGAGHLHLPRSYNINEWTPSNVCKGYETAALKDSVNTSTHYYFTKSGNIINSFFNSKIFKIGYVK